MLEELEILQLIYLLVLGRNKDGSPRPLSQLLSAVMCVTARGWWCGVSQGRQPRARDIQQTWALETHPSFHEQMDSPLIHLLVWVRVPVDGTHMCALDKSAFGGFLCFFCFFGGGVGLVGLSGPKFSWVSFFVVFLFL